LTGVALSFVSPLAAEAVYWLVALMWLIPDRRVEAALLQTSNAAREE